MKETAYLLIIIAIISFGCHNSSPKLDKIQYSTSSQKLDFQDQDSQLTALNQRRTELEKKGYNYSPLIVSKTKITYKSSQLTYIQDLVDSTESTTGKVYVQLLNDSIFTKLFVFDNDSLKYYVGEGVLTNGIDTTGYNSTNFFGFEFTVRCKNYIVIEMVDSTGKGISDSWTIQFLDTDRIFDNPDKI
jgi:hypothetical protein